MPNCYHFSTSFKTLLLNNFSSLKSLGNCELDDSIGALDNLKQFLTGQNDAISNNVPLNLGLNSFSVEFLKPYTSIIGEMTIGYVAGYIIRILINSTNNCNVCINDCIDIHNENKLINIRNFSGKRLRTPSKKFNSIIEHILNILTKTINNICNNPLIFTKLTLLIEANVDLNFICKTHNLKQILIQKIIIFFYLHGVKILIVYFLELIAGPITIKLKSWLKNIILNIKLKNKYIINNLYICIIIKL